MPIDTMNSAADRPERITMYDKDVYSYFCKPGEVIEVRAFGLSGKSELWGNQFISRAGIVSGFFDDHAAFCKAVADLDRLPHSGIYFTLQHIDSRLIARACNRLIPAGLTTSDNNVLAFRWLPVDLDPIRPAGISSSDSELKEALALRDAISDEIQGKYNLPAPIRAVSGNGGHLLYPIIPELPCSKREVIKNLLSEIASTYTTDKVNIDSAVHNPARIWKLYGTKTGKGDEISATEHREARPHRQAYIESIPLGVRT